MDNAAYHFGLAAECAVKHQLIAQHKVQTDHGAIWTHWPELRLQALDALHGRRAAPLRTMMQRDNYLQHWDIKMRYAATGSITTAQLERWRDEGVAEVRFCLGAADGFDDADRAGADKLIAFGRATWPHLMARAMLAEQLYRATSILANHPYHREA